MAIYRESKTNEDYSVMVKAVIHAAAVSVIGMLLLIARWQHQSIIMFTVVHGYWLVANSFGYKS